MPAEARTKDAAGAEAFVRYYIALINRTSQVMDAKPLRDFSQNCRDCMRIARDAEQDAAAGYHYSGGELKITNSGRPLMKGSTAEIAFIADQAALTVTDKAGKPVKGLAFPRYPSLSSGAALSWDPSRNAWIMTTLTLG
ncbi:MAG: hypothetical protein JWP40_2459 [Blastococcus sp.]|nr:hypothetical protein [Blastococcus sp.]